MNITVQIPHGPALDFAPVEARKAAAYLATQLPHVTEFEQGAYLRAIHALELAATPEIHFDVEHYTPPGYQPGWAPDL